MSGYFTILDLGRFTLWMLKGFKGRFYDIDHNKALVVGILVSILLVVLIYVFIIKDREM